MSWKGNPEGHAKAGRLGGLKQSWKTNKANFKNNPERARIAGRAGGIKSRKKPNVFSKHETLITENDNHEKAKEILEVIKQEENGSTELNS